MKFEKEATTKSGRRTWKVTYELVRGPEPKPRRQTDKPKAGNPQAAAKHEAIRQSAAKGQSQKPASKKIHRKKRQAQTESVQLRLV